MKLSKARQALRDVTEQSGLTVTAIARAVGADRPNTSKRIRGVLPVTLEQAERLALAAGHELVLVPIEPRLARRRLLATADR